MNKTNRYNEALDKLHNIYVDKGRRRIYNSLMEFDKLAKDGDNVLDIGGGDKQNDKSHVNFKELFTACHDINYEFVNQNNCDVRYNKLPYENNSFDIVMSHECIEHLWNFRADGMMDYSGIVNFWEESYRVLRPEGVFLVSTRNRNCPLAFSRLYEGYPVMCSICALEKKCTSHAQELSVNDFKAIVDHTGLFTNNLIYSIPSNDFHRHDFFVSKMEQFWERKLEPYELYDTIYFRSNKA
jgi:SAM-dependent methyltransferase